jgi:hypothetical protein
MTSLSRRLERLEVGCRENDRFAADRCRPISSRAFKHLTYDQLKCLQASITSYQQGRPLTSEEAAAGNAFNTATEEESRKTQITVAEYPAARIATDIRS